jgi:predicted dehydrogenase
MGVLGAARIARGFVAGVRGSSRVQVVAIASRAADRAAAFAQELDIPRSFASYDELLGDGEIDAVYNPLPNGLHAPWSIAAARAGKHVLCEKPLACDEPEGRSMFEAAAAAGVELLEAFPYRFQPQTLELLRLISAGTIGEVRVVQAASGFVLDKPDDVRLDPQLGGGALLDVGCYPVSLARLVFGSRPLRASAVAHFTESGVDGTLAGTLEFAGGGLGQISCSFATAAHRRALIAGSEGTIETGYRNHTDGGEPPTLRLKRGGRSDAAFATLSVPRGNGFLLEAEAFADLIERRDRATLGAHRAASLDNLATLAALLESARVRRPVDIPDVRSRGK